MTDSDHVLRYDELEVVVHDDPTSLAKAAATQAARTIGEALRVDGRAAVILATGNSQLQFLSDLADADLAWSKVAVLHMDEYIGLPNDHPASFRRFMLQNFVNRLGPRGPATFYGIQADTADLAAEIDRYERLLRQMRPCLCALGIGENGHLAFNDPPAQLSTSRVMHRVVLDTACRLQQVGERHFPDLESVPTEALTLTVPALLKPPTVVGVVPELRKARAVAAALEGPIGPDCPASSLRGASNATLHLDRESASGLQTSQGLARL
jgi:glucosamine-6-phosphate deaminase